MHNQNRQLTVAARPEARSHEKVELQSAAKVTIPKWVMIVMLSARVVPRPAPHEARGRKTLHGFLYKRDGLPPTQKGSGEKDRTAVKIARGQSNCSSVVT